MLEHCPLKPIARSVLIPMSYLLDTNHCSYVINGDRQVINQLNTHGSDSVGISIITYAELLKAFRKQTSN